MRIKALRLVSAGLLVAALATVGIGWAQERGPRMVTHRWVQQFGMVSPAYGQTLRLHAVHLGLTTPPDPIAPPDLSNPPDPIVPPDPYRIVLAFFDSNGRMIGDGSVRTLELGQSTFVDLNFERPAGDVILPPGPCRAAVWVLKTTRRGEAPPDPCRATLEVLDTASGRASIHMVPAVQRQLPAVQ